MFFGGSSTCSVVCLHKIHLNTRVKWAVQMFHIKRIQQKLFWKLCHIWLSALFPLPPYTDTAFSTGTRTNSLISCIFIVIPKTRSKIQTVELKNAKSLMDPLKSDTAASDTLNIFFKVSSHADILFLSCLTVRTVKKKNIIFFCYFEIISNLLLWDFDQDDSSLPVLTSYWLLWNFFLTSETIMHEEERKKNNFASLFLTYRVFIL